MRNQTSKTKTIAWLSEHKKTEKRKDGPAKRGGEDTTSGGGVTQRGAGDRN